MRDCRFGDLSNVVVSLLHAQTRETECGLSSSAVLLGQVDGELVQDLAGVALKRAEQCAVTVHHNEAESEKETSCQEREHINKSEYPIQETYSIIALVFILGEKSTF